MFELPISLVLVFLVVFVLPGCSFICGFVMFEFGVLVNFELDTGCVCGGLGWWVLGLAFLSRVFSEFGLLLVIYSSFGFSAFSC